MNREIRRITLVVTAMIVALMVTVSVVQFGRAAELRADPRNSRTFYDSFNKDRGPIIALGGTVIASSTAVDDDYAYQRLYLNGPLYAAITGYVSVVGPPSGLELVENEVLEGSADSLFFKRLQDLFTGASPTGGAVELTIDPSVQQAAWNALGNNKGSAVALDVKTGEILALVSKPSFDPNVLASHDPKAAQASYDALEADPNHPLYNRAIGGDLYAPGSTFKLITAAAALESGRYQPDTELDAPRELSLPGTSVKLTNVRDSSCASSGKMTLADALRVSCNTAFGQLGMDLGPAALSEQAAAFGFGQDMTIPLPVQPSVFPQNLDPAQTAMSAIGQLNDRVTPLQMALVAAAIANGGQLMQPQLVKSERDSELRVVAEVTPEELSRPISATTANQLAEMMIDTVENGTASKVKLDGVSVGAKTGTAEQGENEPPDVWMVGFGQRQNRTVAIAVVVEEGGQLGASGTGGAVAGPVMKAILQAVFK
jgi:peptidoglycan glycosyltransferase